MLLYMTEKVNGGWGETSKPPSPDEYWQVIIRLLKQDSQLSRLFTSVKAVLWELLQWSIGALSPVYNSMENTLHQPKAMSLLAKHHWLQVISR